MITMINNVSISQLNILKNSQLNTLTDKNSVDKKFGGQKFSADKIFGTFQIFRHFCPPNLFQKSLCKIFYLAWFSFFQYFFSEQKTCWSKEFGGQKFRRIKVFDGQKFRHLLKISAILSAEFLSNKVDQLRQLSDNWY